LFRGGLPVLLSPAFELWLWLAGLRPRLQGIGRSPHTQLPACGESVVLYLLKARLLLGPSRSLWRRRGLSHQKMSLEPRQYCCENGDLRELVPMLVRNG